MIAILLTLAIATLGILWWIVPWLLRTNRYKAIPGPWGLPVLGNVLQVGRKMHEKFYQWADKYGDIYQIKLGTRNAVIISNPKWIKEMFSGDPVFAGRAILEGFEMYAGEPLGIVKTEGELWEVHRRFLLRQLRDFGFGKSSMEQLILDEVQQVLADFDKSEGGKISSFKNIFHLAVVNSLWIILASKRFAHDDPKLMEMTEDFEKLRKEMINRSIMLFLPWTRFFLRGLKDYKTIRARSNQFYIDAVDEHKQTFDENNLRDFVDVYLAEMKSQENNPESTFYGAKAERQLHSTLLDLYMAGTDTTSTTLSWAVLYLTKFPKIQKKMQEEITSVTGDSRLVSVLDRVNMPYTNGVIEETLRYSSIVPTGVQHRARAGALFKGFYIPEDTWIFPNLYYIHHNPNIWGDPENFRPERFLSEDGQKFERNPNVMAFQVGRRQCVGESLARDTIFLFLTNIVQKYFIRLDPGKPEPSMEPVNVFILMPPEYSVVLEKRKVHY